MSEDQKDKNTSPSHPPTLAEEFEQGPTDFLGDMPPRRKFLFGAAGLLGGLSSIVAGIPIIGYVVGTAVIEDDQWVKAGKVDTFKPMTTTLVQIMKNPVTRPWAGDTAHLPVYIRRLKGDTFLCLSVYCAHLGCPVSWFEQSGLFLCPCHGGVYYADGARASGPPPRGLYHYPHRINKKTQQLEVRVGHLPTLHDVPSESMPSDLESNA